MRGRQCAALTHLSAMDLPIQSIDSLHTEGRDAAKRGEPERINPFPSGCLHHKLWADGHDRAVIAMEGPDDADPMSLAHARGIQ